jgi:hypothetical protein
VEVSSSEQQRKEVLAVGSDTVRVQDTSIVDHERDNVTDVDMPPCQSAEIEGDKDHATLLTAEFNKITTCDTEVCAGNSESFGDGDSGTIGVQEAAAVADHEGAIVDLALASGGGDESVTGVQEAASAADPESMHMDDHEGDDGAPAIILQCNSFHSTNLLLHPPSFLPVHIHLSGIRFWFSQLLYVILFIWVQLFLCMSLLFFVFRY